MVLELELVEERIWDLETDLDEGNAWEKSKCWLGKVLDGWQIWWE